MIPATPFWGEFLRLNQLNPHCRWQMQPGMGFKEQSAWWREQSRRPTPHEGVDLFALLDARGQSLALPARALVPPLWAGEVTALLNDFLGRTVVVCHPINHGPERRLVSLYAHVEPLVDLGTQVSADSPLALIAAAGKPGNSAPPDHLHLSLAWLTAGYPATALNWSTLWNHPALELIDPLPIILEGCI
ncbi:M23 family metallopeptidase [Desulfurivibrio alkaliphilus]|uniref:Peptidase M23 n=1 Tax=Desulfurivibrio alkaliphilus (strain DSM 19089 / UNIQEM U267 / AHT2) TaxID=589865 RepID=D6Z0A4_DESAT|nr:M23 family metallopeptidase [Desulfurivibrio alkaliphilus]ADH87137.1 conserved hypothetical protein [Desulfurivibrio alkaliphilus AHT 2]